MKTLNVEKVIGNTIEGIFELAAPGPANYETKLVLVKLRNLGCVPLELTDPDSPPALRLHVGDAGVPVSDSAVRSLIGTKVVDVIVSRYLASVSLLCDNGSILTSDVLDFGNVAAAISEGSRFIGANEYKSLKNQTNPE